MGRRQQQERNALARRLYALGVPLELDENDRECGLRMYQIPGLESSAINLRSWGTGYKVRMRIVIDLPAFAIDSFDLELPWKDPSISLLEDPIETGNAYNEYCLPVGTGNAYDEYGSPLETSYKFSRSSVLNHYADVRRLHPRGKTLEGLLLWRGNEPIPDSWPLHKMIPAFVTVYDQYDNPYRCPVILTDDGYRKSHRREHKKSTRKPLFECPDFISSDAESREENAENQQATKQTS